MDTETRYLSKRSLSLMDKGLTRFVWGQKFAPDLQESIMKLSCLGSEVSYEGF